MLLGGYALKKAFGSGQWTAFRGQTRLSEKYLNAIIGPNSIDVTLHPTLKIMRQSSHPVDIMDPKTITWDDVDISKKPFLLHPRQMILGAANERFNCTETLNHKSYVQMYDGRSTCGRIGLMSHITAGFGDYGFAGSFTLEISTVIDRPIYLYANMKIGQVYLEEVVEPEWYTGAYSKKHNDGPVAPKLGAKRFFLEVE